MAATRPPALRKRSKTSPGVAASADAASTSGGRRSKKKRGKFPLKRLLRSRSAPVDGDQGTAAGSDGASSSLACPPPSESTVRTRRQRGSDGGRSSSVDGGTPSPSAYDDLRRALRLIEDERHLVAHELYRDAKRRIDEAREAVGQQERESSQHSKSGSSAKKGKVWWRTPESSSMTSTGDEVGRGDGEYDMNEDERAWLFLREKRDEFEALEKRANLFASAKENLSIDDDWIHAQTLFGVSTSYRREADGSLSVKIEGELHGVPLFEQLVVLREVDLYHTWAPFMGQSRKLAQLDRLDVVAWYIVGVPGLGLTRDACYRAVGCDCMNEDGRVLLVAVGLNDTEEHGVKDSLVAPTTDGPGGQSSASQEQSQQQQHGAMSHLSSNLIDTTTSSFLARDEILSTLEIPPIPAGIGRGRMTIRNFSASIDILTPTAARTVMVVNVDPNLQLIPQFMIDFTMKRMCGILLSRLQATARKVLKDPVQNAHARRMREDVHFYRDWLLPKFQVYCDSLGWQMPEVGAFAIEEEELRREGMGWIDDNIQNDANLTTQLTTDLLSNNCGVSEEDTSSSFIESSNSRGERSASASIRSPLGKLKSMVRKVPAEEKIAAARLRAARRLQPKPFSESNVIRLNELKAAKQRAEERLQAKRLGEGSSGDSVSTLQSSFEDLDVDSEVRYFGLLFATSVAAHTALFLLQRYSLLVASLAAQGLFDIAMIALQAVALWALLISSFMYIFDLDFGQKKLVAKMTFGKRLFYKKVKKTALFASISTAAASSCVGLAAGRIGPTFCSLNAVDAVLSTINHLWASIPESGFVMRRILSAMNISDEKKDAVERALETSSSLVTTFCCHARNMVAWSTSKFPSVMPGPLQREAITAFLRSRMHAARWSVCEPRAVASQGWSKAALDISSFLTLRMSVFVLALVILGRTVLPKPEQKVANGTSLESSRTEAVSGNCSVESSLDGSRQPLERVADYWR